MPPKRKRLRRKTGTRYWEQAERSLIEYFQIIRNHLLTSYGICIDPTKLAANEIAWWKSHHTKNYDKVTELLTVKYQLFYKLSAEQARNVACMEVKAMKYYDRAKKGNNRILWGKVLSQNILTFCVLKEELTKKYHGD